MTYTLYKRPTSPYYWMKIAILDTNGSVVSYDRASTKRTDKGEAKLVAASYSRKENDRAQLGYRDGSTIGAAAQRYIDELTSAGKPCIKDYKVFLKRWDYMNSRVKLSSAVAQLTRNALADMKAERLRSGYSPSYVNGELTFWISVYNKAKDDYFMDVSIGQNFKNMKLEVKQKTRYLLDGEEEALLLELDPNRVVKGLKSPESRDGTMQTKLQDQHDLVVFLLDTGARYMEVAEVPWSAVDVINWKTVNLYREKVGNEGAIAITDRLRPILQARYARNGNSPYVFPSPTDMTSPRGYATSGIRNAIARADLNSPSAVKRYGKFTPHSLRHTFASRLVQGGLSLYAVSKLLGHSSTTMTQRYAFLSASQVAQEAADILNAR
jgi:integrase